MGLGTRGRPPFQEVVTHGFIVAEDGRKMSKSLGNSIEPEDIIKESGAEIIRLWVTMVDYREEVRLGKQILARVVEAYRKIRNTCRYLLANLYDFDPAVDRSRVAMMQEVDRYALARYADVARSVLDAYRDYDFPTIFQRVNHLATVDLSAFYADVSKDRLYTFAASSPERRSAQTAMYIIADGLVRLLAPILPMTADELWRHLPGKRDASVHLAEFPRRGSSRRPARSRSWWRAGMQLKHVRDIVNVALEAKRQDKTIGTSLGARVIRPRRRRDGCAAEPLPPRAADAVHRVAGRAVDRGGGRRGNRGEVARAGGISVRGAGGSSTRSRPTPAPKASVSAAWARLRRRHERGRGTCRSAGPSGARASRGRGTVRPAA